MLSLIKEIFKKIFDLKKYKPETNYELSLIYFSNLCLLLNAKNIFISIIGPGDPTQDSLKV